MNEKQKQILHLLEQGFTYSQIQEALRVSPKVISAVKKEYFPSGKYSNDSTSNENFPKHPFASLNADIQVTKVPDYNQNYQNYQNLNNNLKNNRKMNYKNDQYEDEDDMLISRLEVEKYKLQLSHELEMEKLRIQSEERDRELGLKEKELELKQKAIDNASRIKEEEKTSLLFRIKTIATRCEDGEFTLEEAEELFKDAKKLLKNCEEYIFVNQINTDGRNSIVLLKKIIEDLDTFIEEFDEDEYESMDLEFDPIIDEIISNTKFSKF